MKSVKALLFAIAVMLSAPVFAQAPTSANMEILRQKLKADKKLVVAANMPLSDAEAKSFWPVYDAYQVELEQINRRLLATIKAYADAYRMGNIGDELAKKLLAEWLAVEEAESGLKRAYIPRLEKVLPGAKVTRYLQIENKIRAIVRYDLAAEIPLVP
jgi:hypothetical protein